MKIQKLKLLLVGIISFSSMLIADLAYSQCRGNFFDSGPVSNGGESLASKIDKNVEVDEEVMKQMSPVTFKGKVIKNSFIGAFKYSYGDIFNFKIFILLLLVFLIFFLQFFNFKDLGANYLLPIIFAIFYLSLVMFYDLKGVLIFNNLETSILIIALAVGTLVSYKCINIKIISFAIYSNILFVLITLFIGKVISGITFSDDPSVYLVFLGDILTATLWNSNSINSDSVAHYFAYFVSILLLFKVALISLKKVPEQKERLVEKSFAVNLFLGFIWLFVILMFKQGGLIFSFFIFGSLVKKNDFLKEKKISLVLISTMLLIGVISLTKKLMYFDETFFKMFTVVILVIILSIVLFVIFNMLLGLLIKKVFKIELDQYDFLIMIPHVAVSALLCNQSREVKMDLKVNYASISIMLMLVVTSGILSFFR